MPMKFNDELFYELQKLTCKPAIIPAPNDLESVLRVCEQRSDRSRKDAFNSNCIIDGIPFTWDYTSYNAVVDPEDSSNNLDITYRILTFPMIKRTTGWSFFLDVEENGSIWISEGIGTQRTRIPLRKLNDLHWYQRKVIADTIRQLCDDSLAPFDFCESHGGLVTVDYSYILSQNVPGLHECQSCRGFKKLTTAQCQIKKPYSSNVASNIIAIFNCSDEDGRSEIYHTHLYSGKLYDDVQAMFMEKDPACMWDLENSIKSIRCGEDRLNDALSIIKNIPSQKRVFFDANALIVYEHYRDIPEISKPNVFVKDTRNNKLCQPYFNDVIDIDLYNDKVYFEHDHSEVFDK